LGRLGTIRTSIAQRRGPVPGLQPSEFAELLHTVAHKLRSLVRDLATLHQARLRTGQPEAKRRLSDQALDALDGQVSDWGPGSELITVLVDLEFGTQIALARVRCSEPEPPAGSRLPGLEAYTCLMAAVWRHAVGRNPSAAKNKTTDPPFVRFLQAAAGSCGLRAPTRSQVETALTP
jgi:hypothetical protein